MTGDRFYPAVDRLVNLIPRRTAYVLARQVAGWAYRCKRRERHALMLNLRTVLEYRGTTCEGAELERIVRRNFENFAKYVVDFLRMDALEPDALRAVIAVEHGHYLKECQAMQRGIVGLTAHLGNWELATRVLAAEGIVVNAIVLPQRMARRDALFQARRANRGIHVLPMRGGASAALAHLRRNELVAVLGDLDFTGTERRTPFFGMPAPLPRGPAVLAARSGAPVLPGFVLRQADDSFVLRFCPPIMPGRHASATTIHQQIRTVLEAAIGATPEQWFAFKPLWETGKDRKG